ncbi:Glu S.griseus protease inhibitor [Dendrobium catenatum]|uniref:Glu S.griseus protease inhibitor n=1 Tax=Dendrobium catenatum TaxID=906689 RepID=A0A2I0VLF4_9ASPA|nr:Glu S.griseus protease inhibitor [Dendrobium catenatum]
MFVNVGSKQSWPELVGHKGWAAKEVIERENPDVHAILIRSVDRVIMNCCCDRVWIWVECPENVNAGEGIVIKTPKVG